MEPDDPSLKKLINAVMAIKPELYYEEALEVAVDVLLIISERVAAGEEIAFINTNQDAVTQLITYALKNLH